MVFLAYFTATSSKVRKSTLATIILKQKRPSHPATPSNWGEMVLIRQVTNNLVITTNEIHSSFMEIGEL
uniref:Uncharacterized protein n=1 Tax=Electrophorus electricus TaxID=8005 RepID=A0AAY5EDM3_ELEEL